MFQSFNYEKLKKGLTGAVTVAAGAVSKGLEVAKDLAEDLTSFKALKDYKLAGHVATAGPGNTWKIYSAINKKPGAVFPEASVWILDKKGLTDQASRAGRARGFETFFEQQRRGCNQLLRIKHPGVVKVIEPLEETGGQMVFVTEPVFGSLNNLLTQFRDVPTAPPERASTALSHLELKYGLCNISETLHFLHHEAKLVHCNINPGSIVLTSDGCWKLSGFEFVTNAADGFGGGGGNTPLPSFEYSSAHPSPWEEYSQPPLGFTAPELVGGCVSAGSDVSPSGGLDAFSLAALAYLLVAGKELLPVGSSTGEYRSRLRMMSGAELQGVPHSLQSMLHQMLSMTPSARPNAAAFSSCQWFQEDMLLRCLKFLDSILQRDTGQKVAFLKDLSTFWQQFDERLLHHRVLPPVVAEMRHEVVALAALPLVLNIMGRMKPQAFAASGILPVLKPIFEHADGEVLLALVKHMAVFYNLMPSESHVSVLVPLMLRAFDSSTTRVQEELLKALQVLAPDMAYNILREVITPRVVGLCLRTTSLVVRVSALRLMAQAVHRLDKEAAGSMLDVCSQIVAVDRSAGTAMAVLQLGDAIGQHYGPDVTALRVLPLLCPLLLCPGLNTAQFSSYMNTIRGLLDKVAEKRGGELAATAAGAAAGTAVAGRGSGGLGSSTAVGTSNGLGDGLFGGSAGASPKVAAGVAAWDVPVASNSSSSSSSRPAAAAAAAGESWSSAAWTSSSTGALGGSSGSSMSPWGGSTSLPSSNQQHWQQQQQHSSAPRPAGMPAPDIFSSSNPSNGIAGGGGDLLAGLSLKGGSGGSGDLFGGLAVTGTAAGAAPRRQSGSSNSGGYQRQQQQQQQQPMALKPPPAAPKSISLIGGAGAGSSMSSNSKDPFAGLLSGGASSSGSSAAAAGGSGGFDPFSALASSTPASSGLGGVDAFAGLASGINSSSSKPVNAARQQTQQWPASGGGSLI